MKPLHAGFSQKAWPFPLLILFESSTKQSMMTYWLFGLEQGNIRRHASAIRCLLEAQNP